MIKTLKDINWNQVYCFFEVARKLSMKRAGQCYIYLFTDGERKQIKNWEKALTILIELFGDIRENSAKLRMEKRFFIVQKCLMSGKVSRYDVA